MKAITIRLSALCAATLLLFSCNEKLTVDAYVAQAPIIHSFSPTTGPIGTLITVTGEYLQNIDTAWINGGKVVIQSKINANELILRTTVAGRTGKILLYSPQGEVESEESYTYTYATPAITQYPATFLEEDVAVIIGTNLNCIQSVKFGSVEAQIVEVTPEQLVVKVPSVGSPTADITFTYFNGTSNQTIQKTGAQVLRQLPLVTSYDPATGIETGATITLTGKRLHLVDSVKIGNTKMFISNKPENGLSLKFMLVDNTAEFTDLLNTKPLKLYAFAGTEVVTADNSFAFTVPSYYKWTDAKLNGASNDPDFQNHFFCLEDGTTSSIYRFATDVDPVTMTTDPVGRACRVTNRLIPSITAEQYYSVKPYVFMLTMGSGFIIYAPSHNGVRAKDFVANNKDKDGKTIPGMPTDSLWGTPIIQMRVLNKGVTAEKAIIDKVLAGNFPYTEFTPALLNSIDITMTGDDTDDGYSNLPRGEINHFAAPGKSVYRPWATPPFTANNDLITDMNSVMLVLYYRPNWGTFSYAYENVYKFGFIHFTHVNRNASGGSADTRKSTATFNAYWKRTPITPAP